MNNQNMDTEEIFYQCENCDKYFGEICFDDDGLQFCDACWRALKDDL